MPNGRRRKGRARATGRGKALIRTFWGAATVLLLSGVAAGVLYTKLNGNIHSIDINGQLGNDRPAAGKEGENILVIGSDSRSGKNQAYGRDEGSARSDTAMVVHLYPGRKKAAVVSIPRDTLIHRPECKTADGKVAPARNRVMFNATYSLGGAACTVKTVEAMTGLRMDHFIEVDFTGFKKLVDTLGGVPITVNRAIKDKDSHLDIGPGHHTLDGEQALALVRTRKRIGDGSDLGRIRVQHEFLKALLKQIKKIDLLDSPKKLYDLADTATRSLTTDTELASIDALTRFARSLNGLDPQDVLMLTLPVTEDSIDHNRVVPLERKAAELWQALRANQPVPSSATAQEGSLGSAAAKSVTG